MKDKIEEVKKIINTMNLDELEILSLFMENKLKKIPYWKEQNKKDDIYDNMLNKMEKSKI